MTPSEPKRIQRKRVKGWKMPENAVYVGRPTEWGNIWTVGSGPCGCRSVGECYHNVFARDTAEEAVTEYRRWIVGILTHPNIGHERRAKLKTLRGKDLACWCPPNQACHADVLLELANGEMTR